MSPLHVHFIYIQYIKVCNYSQFLTLLPRNHFIFSIQRHSKSCSRICDYAKFKHYLTLSFPTGRLHSSGQIYTWSIPTAAEQHLSTERHRYDLLRNVSSLPVSVFLSDLSDVVCLCLSISSHTLHIHINRSKNTLPVIFACSYSFACGSTNWNYTVNGHNHILLSPLIIDILDWIYWIFWTDDDRLNDSEFFQRFLLFSLK